MQMSKNVNNDVSMNPPIEFHERNQYGAGVKLSLVIPRALRIQNDVNPCQLSFWISSPERLETRKQTSLCQGKVKSKIVNFPYWLYHSKIFLDIVSSPLANNVTTRVTRRIKMRLKPLGP